MNFLTQETPSVLAIHIFITSFSSYAAETAFRFFHRTTSQFQHYLIPLCYCMDKMQPGRKKKKKSPTDNRLSSCCLEAFIGCFSVKCLPCLTLIAVKGLKRPCKAQFGGFQQSALPSYNILSISIGYSVQRYRLPSPITLRTFCSGCNTFQSFGSHFPVIVFIFLMFSCSSMYYIRKLIHILVLRNIMFKSL